MHLHVVLATDTVVCNTKQTWLMMTGEERRKRKNADNLAEFGRCSPHVVHRMVTSVFPTYNIVSCTRNDMASFISYSDRV